jgi:hypothetical protein
MDVEGFNSKAEFKRAAILEGLRSSDSAESTEALLAELRAIARSSGGDDAIA